MALRKIKPHYFSFWSLTGVRPVHGDAMSLLQWTIMIFHCGFFKYTINEMPVFEPNEYFWKNHWDGKEEKWKAYARTMRQIIADEANLKLSSCTQADKVHYKKMIRNGLPPAKKTN